MRLIPIIILAMAVAAPAQEPLHAPTPLISVPGVTPATAGSNALTLTAAQRAQELGFPSAAAALYRELLAQPGGDRGRMTLALTTALLDEGKHVEAALALQGHIGLRGTCVAIARGTDCGAAAEN